MLRARVVGVGNNPGTGPVTINSTPAGKQPWSSFGNGAVAAHVMTDGTSWEYGVSTVSVGASTSLDRGTVLLNSLGTTAKVNFTGAVTVYNDLPPELALFRDVAGNVAVGGGRLTGVGAPSAAGDAATKGYADDVPGMIHGLTLSNNATFPATVVNVAAGQCTSDTTPRARLSLSDAASVNLGVTGTGGLDAGVKAPNTTYHLHLIGNGTTVSGLASTSATSPIMPSGYTARRRIGAVLTDGIGNIRGFLQYGDEFWLNAQVADVNANTGTASFAGYTLTVPSGVSVTAILGVNVLGVGADNVFLRIEPINATDAAADASNASLVNGTNSTIYRTGAVVRVPTSPARAIHTRANYSVNHRINTMGWVDARGRT